MTTRGKSVVIGVLATLIVATAANAYEFGSAGGEAKPGIVVGAAAVAPPPGLYGFNQVFTTNRNSLVRDRR